MSFQSFKARIHKNRENDGPEIVKPIALNESDAKKEEVTKDVLSENTLSSKLKSIFGFNKPDTSLEDHMTKIEKMTKAQLDKYAEQYDIHLDRRLTKQNMINEFIQKLKEKN